MNRIGGVMVSVLAFSVIDLGFETDGGHANDDTICICCFSAKNAAFEGERIKTGWLWGGSGGGDMETPGLLFQWASTIKIQLSVLVYYKADIIIISLKINLLSPWNR